MIRSVKDPFERGHATAYKHSELHASGTSSCLCTLQEIGVIVEALLISIPVFKV